MPLVCIHAGSPSQIYIFAEDTPNNGTPSGSDVSVFQGPSDLTQARGAVIDDGSLIVLDDSGDEVFWFTLNLSGSPVTASKRVDLPALNALGSALTVVGNEFAVYDVSQRRLYFYPLATADGAEAVFSKYFFININGGVGLASDGNDIYVGSASDGKIDVVSATTAHQQVASIIRTILLPSDITAPYGITLKGNDLYIADLTDFKIYRIDADTPHNTVAVIRQEFNLPTGLTNPQALAFQVGQATVEITTSDTDIRGGEVVDFNIEFSSPVTDFVASDVIVTGGTRGALSGSGTSWVLRVTVDSGTGTIVLGITEDAVSPGNVVASVSFTRTAKPTATVTFAESLVIGGQDVTATLTFSESVSGLTVGDLSVNVGTLSNFSGSGDTYTVDVTAPATGSGTLTLTLGADSVDEGNAVVTGSVDYAPFTASWSNVPTGTVGATFSAELNFSHRVTDFTADDLTLRRVSGNDSNSSFRRLTAGEVTLTAIANTNNYALDFDLDGTYDGVYMLRLRRNTVTAGTEVYPTSHLNTVNIEIDTDPTPAPTVGITFDPTTVRNGRTTEATIVWSAAVTGFALADVSVDVGTLSNFSGSGDTYTVDVTAPVTGSGNIALTIAEDAVTEGNAEYSASVAYSALPTVGVTFSPATVRNGRQTTATIVWSEVVTDFAVADVSVDVGTLLNFSGSGDTYTVDVTAPATGTGTITLTVAADAVGVGNAETTADVVHQPLPTVAVTFDPTAVRAGRTTAGRLVWSETVTGFSLADLSVDVGTLSNFSGSGDTYTVDVGAPATGSGTIVLTVREDSVDEGNAAASASVGYSPLPTVSISFNRENVIAGQDVTATLTFSESVTGLTAADLALDFGTVGTVAGTGTTWTAVLTAPSTGTGTMTLTVAVDAVDEGLAATEASVGYSPFIASFSAPEATVNNSFSEQLNFSHRVTGLEVSDLRLRRVSGNDGNLNFIVLDTANVTITAIANTNNYTLEFDLDGTFDGVYMLRLRRGSVTSGSEDYPSSALDSDNFTIDSSHGVVTSPTVTVSFDGTLVRGGRVARASIEWSESVSDFVVGDLSLNVGTLSNFSGSGTTYTVDVTAPVTGTGTMTLTVAADAVNAGNVAVSGDIAYSPLPTVAVTFDSTLVRGGRTTVARLMFSESVTGLTLADVSVDVGTLSNFSGSGDTYTVDVIAPATGSGNIRLTVREDAVNEGNGVATGSVAYQPLPTVAVTFSPVSVRGGRVTVATLVFSESVTGINLADVSVDVGTLSNFSGSGDTYTVEVTAPVSGSGNIRLTVREDAAVEGNAVTTGLVAYQPLATVAITFDPTTVRSGRTTVATLLFSESVTGFAIGDLSVNVGTLSNFAGSGDSYTVDITAPVSGSGNIVLTVVLDAVNEGLTATQGSVSYSPLPTVAITFDAASVRSGRTVEAMLVFSESVTGLTLADVSVDVGSVATLIGAGDTYTVEVTAPSMGTGNIDLTVRADAVNEGNIVTTGRIPYLPLPTVAITFPITEIIPGGSVVAGIAWSETVSGFTTADITVMGIGASVVALTGSGRAYQLTIQTLGSGTGMLRVRIRRDAVSVGNNETQATLDSVIPGQLAVSIRSGYASRYVQPIGMDDPADFNDYAVGFWWERGVDGFDADDVIVSGAVLVGFRKFSDRYYEAVIRPPDRGSGTITVSVNSGAVTEGNRATSETFGWTDAVVREFVMDWDAVLPNVLQGDSDGQYYGPITGLVVEGSRLRLLTFADGALKLFMLTQDGVRVTSGDEVVNISGAYLGFIYERHIAVNLSLVNDRWFASSHNQDNSQLRRDYFNTFWSYVGSGAWIQFAADDFGIDETAFGLSGATQARNAAHSADINRWGLFFPSQNGRVYAQNFDGMQQNISGLVAATEGGGSTPMVALGDRVYDESKAFRAVGNSVAVAIRDENLNISTSTSSDYSAYGKWLYYTVFGDLYRVDLEKYRSPVVRDRIVPQFVVEGESLDLKHFVNGAARILFESAYDAPAYLSLDSNMNLVVADGVVSEDTCVLVKLRAFSFRGETPFRFYLVVLAKETPVWKDVAVLPVDNGETVDLFDLVENAKRIAWKTGFLVPSGYSLVNGKLTVENQTSETPVVVELTAFNDEGGRDIRFKVLPRVPGAIISSEVYDYRVLIDGIDVTEDLLEIASIHHSLDVINPNEFVSDDASFVLSSDAGKYDGRVAGNFWDANGLNENGYLANVEIWVDILDDPTAIASKLLFEGLIIEVQSSINGVSAVVNCVDRTYTIKNTALASVGLEKYAALDRVRETYEGVYAPDAGLLPIGRSDVSVVSGFEAVRVDGYQNAPESVAGGLSCYVTANQVLTRGGYFEDDPLLKFRTPYQRRRLDFLIKRLSEASGYFNTKVEISTASLATERHITSRGNVAFNVDRTRTTRTVVDWVHDAGKDVFYFLLSHPSGYVRDILVSYNPVGDRYETLWTFAAGLAVVQLASSDYDTFYVLATEASDFDRMESPEPSNYSGAVTDNWDSSRETGATRILRYVVSTDRETTFVDVDDDYPPQVGVHYMAGFENLRHIRWREGIFSESRSRFVVYNNELYYRYATWEGFGVARADSSGSTSALLSADRDAYFNMLNFAFDVTADGDVYMVSSDGGPDASGLVISKYDGSNGAVTEVVDLREGLGTLTVLDGQINGMNAVRHSPGGAYLGCYEVLFANGRLYCVVPVQRVSLTDAGSLRRDIKKSAGAVLYSISSDGFDVAILKRYDYVQLSCRSLTLHDNEVYFAEYPNASTHYVPSNPDLSNWDAGTRRNAVAPNKVWLHRVRGGRAEGVVSPWYEGRPFNATAVGMLSDGSRLHAIVRYADKFGISAVDSDAGRAENEQWVTLGEEIPFYVERLPRGSLHAAMVAFAKLGNARLQIVANRFRFVDVDPTEALLASGLSSGASRLNYKDANKVFPQSGYVLVNGEIIGYSGRGNKQLTGLSRGVGGTEAASHTVGARVLFVDKVIHRESLFDEPYEDISIRIDTNKFYNVVRDSDNTAAAVDRESVSRLGGREYVTDLLLSDHQIQWRRYINAKTLNRLKDIKSVVRLRMRASYYLDIGDVVTFAYGGELLMPIQIIDIQHTQVSGDNPQMETHIIGQEVKALPRVSFGAVTIADKTFNQYEPIAAFTLPEAEDPKASYVYRLEGLGAGLTFDAATRTVSGRPEDPQVGRQATYIVTDRENPTVSARLTFDITVTETTLTFLGRQSDLAFGLGVAVSETLVGASGGTGALRYELSGALAGGVSFDGMTRRLTGTPTALHGARNYRYRVRDDRGVRREQTFSIETVLVNRYMVVQSFPSDRRIYVFGFDGSRVVSEDRLAADLPGLWGPSVGQPSIGLRGATSSPTRIAFLRAPTDPSNITLQRQVFVYDRSWNRRLSEGADLPTGYAWDALAWLPGHWLLLDNTDDRIVFYDTSWVEQTGRQIDLPAGDWSGLAVTADRIHPLDDAGESLHSYTYTGTAMASERLALGAGNWEGATSTPDGVAVMEGDRNNNKSYLRLYDNNLSSAGSINLNVVGGNLFFLLSVLALNPTTFLR